MIYVIRGRARMRWGANLEFTAEASPGGFMFVPHQEINALDDEPLDCVVTRSGQEPIVVKLDIDGVAEREHLSWVDPAHPVMLNTVRRKSRSSGGGCLWRPKESNATF